MCETKNNKLVIKIKQQTTNISPLRYPGGKTRACKVLDEVLNQYFAINDFKNIVSPFFGGGSFEFHVQNKYNMKIIANDKFKPLYTFWNICKYNKEALCDQLYKSIGSIDKKTFSEYREKIMIENNNLSQAFMYFVINRCSFSGATLSGGFSSESSKKRFTTSSVDRVKQLNLINFEIYNLDYEKFIDQHSETENLLFLDPPYYLEKNSRLYGKNGDMHENFDHVQLYTCLSSKKNWFMTYNNCEYIKNLYKDFKIIETNWSYGMNKSKISSEIIIIG